MTNRHLMTMALCATVLLLAAGPALAQAPAGPPPSDTARPAPKPPAPDVARPAPATPRPAPGKSAAAAPWDAAHGTKAATADPAPTKAADKPQKTKKKAKKKAKRKKAWKKILHLLHLFHPSTLWYLQFRAGDTGGTDGRYNKFFVGRGYLTLKFKATDWFEARVTMDTHQDDHGDWKVRLKYLYAKFKVPMETAVVSEPFAEFGLAHMPWLDYEEHINPYRVQGTMFVERNKLHNSADMGLTLGTLLGRKLPKKVARAMHDKYPGSWGSLAIGVYNGGGYHDLENNENKVFEGRVSIRPGGPYFPYVQLSYFFTYGKGAHNLVIEDDPATPADESYTGEFPTWQSNIAMLSFMHKYGVLTAQYAFGTGSQKGNQSNWLFQPGDPGGEDGNARKYKGASVFAEVRLPWIKSSVFGRYDWWDGPYAGGTDPYHRIIAGYAFHFWGRNANMLLVDFEYLLFDAEGDTRENQWAVTLSAQIKLH